VVADRTMVCQCDADAAPLESKARLLRTPLVKGRHSYDQTSSKTNQLICLAYHDGIVTNLWEPCGNLNLNADHVYGYAASGAPQLSTGELPTALAWDSGGGGGEVAMALCDQRRVLLLPVDRCATASTTSSTSWRAPPPPGHLYARELTHAADDDQGRGFFDVAFGVRGPYAVLAAGADGAVRLWDRRAASEPRAVMESASSGRRGARLLSLQLSADEQVIAHHGARLRLRLSAYRPSQSAHAQHRVERSITVLVKHESPRAFFAST